VAEALQRPNGMRNHSQFPKGVENPVLTMDSGCSGMCQKADTTSTD